MSDGREFDHPELDIKKKASFFTCNDFRGYFIIVAVQCSAFQTICNAILHEKKKKKEKKYYFF